jgi:hypothetical protein
MAIARPMPLDPPLTNTRIPASDGVTVGANFGSEMRVRETVTHERRQQSMRRFDFQLVVVYNRRMELLVSVSNAAEAQAAVDGGAGIIDAKDPFAGALGAVQPEVFSQICAAVDASRLVTAALGDAHDGVEELAQDFVARVRGS